MEVEGTRVTSQMCLRCGIVWEVNSVRNNQEICYSCRSRKQGKVGDCIIWQGHYSDDFVTPIDDDGNEVLPGKRKCGHKDCVSPSHIERK